MNSGTVTRIQRFSLSDGPGIRSTVFLKGCRMRCLWCANPETRSASPELAFRANLCLDGCRLCVSHCGKGALSRQEGHGLAIDRKKCVNAFDCVDSCPSGALSRYGREMIVSQVMDELVRDAAYYRNSGGGVTLSGGDPLFQPAFSAAILEACRVKDFHTAIDTAGYASWDILSALLQTTDLVLYDIKHIDARKHEAFTGVDNEVILENALRTALRGTPMMIRVPLIPGFNDAEDELSSIGRFVAGLPGVLSLTILPYHRLGIPKFEMLGLPWTMADTEPPTTADLERAQRILGVSGVPVVF